MCMLARVFRVFVSVARGILRGGTMPFLCVLVPAFCARVPAVCACVPP